MRQSVLFPIRTKSENAFRRGDPKVHHAINARQKEFVRLILDAELRHMVPPCAVLLCRVSAGTLDDDNLRGAFKHIRDSVAKWLGVDDADPRVTWDYAQDKGAPKRPAVRITIDDHRPDGEDHAKDLVARSALAPRRRPAAKPARSPRSARSAPAMERVPRRAVEARAPRRSFVQLPGSTELKAVPGLEGVAAPPSAIRVVGFDGTELRCILAGSAIDPEQGEGHLYRPEADIPY